MIPEKFNLSSLGEGRVTEVLHEGKMFNLYRAHVNGQDVALKTPAPDSTGETVFAKTVFEGSETFYSTGQGLENLEDPIKVATWFLIEEAQIINSTKGAWNHEVIALGTWDGLSNLWGKGRSESAFDHEPLDLRFLPVLVMPFYEATNFSTLPNYLKKLLFPKMLPALWDALYRRRHGDLSEKNLLINQTQNIFHLIDPGVYISSNIEGLGSTFFSFFTTNSPNYPIIAPFSGQKHRNAGLANLVKLYYEWLTPADQPQTADYSPNPVACDLLALGIMYYRILTGKEFFADNEFFPQMPVWAVSSRSPLFENLRIHQLIGETLFAGYVQDKLAGSNLSGGERQLAQGLLNFEVFDRSHLSKLIFEVEQAGH